MTKRWFPFILLIVIVGLTLVALCGAVLLTKWIGGDPDLWVFALGIPGMMLVVRPLSRLKSKLDGEEYERRLAPVRDSIETCWVMDGPEADYQQQLLQQLFLSLGVISKPEAPLPTGTRVDGYMEFGNEDWYITIKRGLNNQKRLLLQGEIEDIILHAPRRDRDLWIFVIVGLDEDQAPQDWAHLGNLCEYAVHRSVYNTRGKRTGEKKVRVNIEIMPAMIPSPETRRRLAEEASSADDLV